MWACQSLKVEETVEANFQVTLRTTKVLMKGRAPYFRGASRGTKLVGRQFREEVLSQCHFGCRFRSAASLRLCHHASHPLLDVRF